MKPKTSHLPKKSSTSSQHPRGFALIVTLSLMILLTVIAVGLLSLASISLRSSSQSESMQAARANAKVALMLAIGDLQKQLGPDTRISVTADQTAAADNPSVSSTPQAQRHWTGAYKAWPAGLPADPRPTPEFLQWFVSGDPAKLSTKAFAAANLAPDPKTNVEIVSANAVGATGDPVRVPMISQTITGGKNNLAWWTSDEGMKACVPADPSPTANGTSTQRLAMQAAPSLGVQLMADSTGTKTPLAALDQESDVMRKLITIKQTELAVNSASRPDLKQLFHDISTQNRGLLTNVRSGGFRRDLSMILQAPATSVPRTPLYSVGGRDGINLAELWAYHNLCGELTPLSGKYLSGAQIPSGTLGFLQKSSLSSYLTDKFYYQKQPAFIRFQQLISFLAKPKVPATNPATYDLGIVIDPIITVWNPLDVPLSLTGSFLSVKYFALPYDLTVTLNGVSQTLSLGKIVGGLTNAEGGNFLSMRIGNGSGKPLVLKPGEVMTFSQKNAPTAVTGGGAQQVESQPGWVYDPTGGGFYYPFSANRAATLVSGTGSSPISYAVNPNSDRSLGTDYASAHHIYYKYDRTSDGESKSIGYYTINNRIRANDPKYLSFFDKITPSAKIPLNELTSKRPFMAFSFLAKSEEGSENPGRFLARHNPRAIKMDFYDLEQNEQRMMPFEIRTQAVTSVVGMDQIVGETQSNGNGYFGGGWTQEYGSTSVITHSVPRVPPVSLGAFQHSMANGFMPDATGRIINYSWVPVTSATTMDYLMPQIDHAIGNSLAPSLLAANQTEGAIGGGRPIADHSYLANQALWDDYYLSGISPQKTKAFTTQRDHKKVAQDFLLGSGQLPVKQYKLNLQGQDPDATLAKLFTGSNVSPDAEKLTASLLAVEGMFNVNSTSVEAWKAVLSGLRNRDIAGQNPAGADATISSGGSTPNASLLTPANAKVTTDSSGKLNSDTLEAQWSGIHMISDQEIAALAKALVIEVRKRGPFLSLADFVNRRVGNDKELALGGAIQSALDSNAVTLNQPFRTGDRAATSNEDGLNFPEAERGAAAYGIPSYVKQADILTPIAPLISARSDTFVIRGYGERTNAAGTSVIAKACCEAVIQRGASFVDPSNGTTTATGSLSPSNKTFGRRFEIVSFRWLNSSEI